MGTLLTHGPLTKTLFVRVLRLMYLSQQRNGNPPTATKFEEIVMKIWNKPQVREQAVGMEVTAYLPADIDLI